MTYNKDIPCFLFLQLKIGIKNRTIVRRRSSYKTTYGFCVALTKECSTFIYSILEPREGRAMALAYYTIFSQKKQRAVTDGPLWLSFGAL